MQNLPWPRGLPSSLLFVAAATGVLVAVVFAPAWVAPALSAALAMVAAAMTASAAMRRSRPHHSDGSPPAAQAPLPDLVTGPTGSWQITSVAVPRRLGWRVGHFSSLQLDEFIHAHDLPRLVSVLDAHRGQTEPAQVDVQVRLADAWRWVALELLWVDGASDGFDITHRDATAHRSTDERLGEREDQLLAVADVAEVARAAPDVRTASNAVELAVTGTMNLDHCGVLWSDDAVGHDLAAAAVAQNRPVARDDNGNTGPLDELHGSVICLALPFHDGAALTVTSAVPKNFAAADVAFLQSLADVLGLTASRLGAERRAVHHSRHDDLTGLSNRTAFLERLDATLRRARRQEQIVSVLLLSLDNVEVVTDGLGPDAHDEVVTASARLLEQALRPGDELARLDSDEFVVLSPDSGSVEAAMVSANRLCSALGAPADIAGRTVTVSVSAGVAVGDVEGLAAGELLRRADAAHHRARLEGGGRVQEFDPDLIDAASERLRVEEELRDALTSGELRLFFQPVVELATGATVAVEALVRWMHPTRGLLTPDDFLPISAESDLIEQIGVWVMEQAIVQAATWQAEGKPLRVTVNLAARQLGDGSMLAHIERGLADAGLDSARLGVELTQAALLTSGSPACDDVMSIAELGVAVGVDDFGTAASSLLSLRELPVTEVKLDGRLVGGIDRNGDDYAIVASMIGLAHTLGARVVAEGVETDQQLALLQDLGCDLAQGHLFSGPVPEIEQRVTHEYRQHDTAN